MNNKQKEKKAKPYRTNTYCQHCGEKITTAYLKKGYWLCHKCFYGIK